MIVYKTILFLLFLSLVYSGCRLNLEVYSAGLHDGNSFSLKINGVDSGFNKGRGFNIGVFNPYTKAFES